MMMSFILLALPVSAEISNNSLSRDERSATEESFEEKLQKGYELLKDQPSADESTMLMQQLHSIEEKIDEELTLTSEEEDVKVEKNRIKNVCSATVEINLHSNLSMTLFQADMLPTKEQVKLILEDIEGDKNERIKRQAYRDDKYPETIWQNGLVPYFYYSNITKKMRNVFKRATEIWESYTCVKFFKNSTAPDRIGVLRGTGCFSSVGRIGGEQSLSLGPGCESIGTVTHEIGHALGFFHTHSRHDRDSFVKVLKKNIMNNMTSAFIKQSKRINYNYNLTYDYGSLMHYGKTAFTKNGLPTMKPRDADYSQTLGSSIVSFYDKLMMNLHYGCLDKCDKNSSAKCYNGGFPNPSNCSECVCPSGYGGRHCNRRPKGCGRILIATRSLQTLTDILGEEEVQFIEDGYIMCNYWILAPIGSKIEVQHYTFSEGFAKDGCTTAGVEIKTGEDICKTGYRFCSRWAGPVLVSTNNIVPVLTYTTPGEVTTTVLRYRIRI